MHCPYACLTQTSTTKADEEKISPEGEIFSCFVLRKHRDGVFFLLRRRRARDHAAPGIRRERAVSALPALPHKTGQNRLTSAFQTPIIEIQAIKRKRRARDRSRRERAPQAESPSEGCARYSPASRSAEQNFKRSRIPALRGNEARYLQPFRKAFAFCVSAVRGGGACGKASVCRPHATGVATGFRVTGDRKRANTGGTAVFQIALSQRLGAIFLPRKRSVSD